MKLQIPILYSQVALFSADVENPYNDWTDQHVAQGFSWRPKSLSFAIPGDSSELEVTVRRAKNVGHDPAASRVIVVPLEIAGGKGAEFGNVMETVPVELDDGAYTVLFQLFLSGNPNSGRAEIAISSGTCVAAIVKADAQLDVPEELLMEAVAAQ